MMVAVITERLNDDSTSVGNYKLLSIEKNSCTAKKQTL